MLELGPSERALHAGLAEVPALGGIDTVHCVGERMRALHEVLPRRLRGEWFATAAEMAAQVRHLLDSGDIAMVKGSRGARVDLVVEAIKRLGDARPAATAVEG
jgi:UDP-N-acetylmuramoyl-tripeptide--D-alanyl-D-alanine ligase